MVWQWHVPPNSWINRLKIWLGWLRRWCDPMSVLLYASETWTLTVADSKSLDAFHMKCQRRILGITWHQFVRNEEIATRTGLPPLSTTICCRRSAIFGHLARLGDEVPAHKALHSCIRLSQGRLPDPTRKRRPGRLRADQWKLAIKRGHGGRATLRSQDYATSWPDLRCRRVAIAVTGALIFDLSQSQSKSQMNFSPLDLESQSQMGWHSFDFDFFRLLLNLTY